MKLLNLRERSDLLPRAIELIEESFEYSSENSFAVDFYPLVGPDNLENCWVLDVDGNVVAHSGVARRAFAINGETFPVALIGGVAVDKGCRGKGYASVLLRHILSSYSDCSCFILWSDKLEMYEKRGFFPCLELFEAPQVSAASTFKKESIDCLSPEDLLAMQQLYSKSDQEIRLDRSSKDWTAALRISSSDLYLKRNEQGQVSNYFFINKGQDLSGIIHEYGSIKDRSEMTNHGKLWSPWPSKNSKSLFGALARPASPPLFDKFIRAMTQEKIQVSSAGKNIEFSFGQNAYTMESREFLQGVFGPGRFTELDDLPKLFIGGLDSV